MSGMPAIMYTCVGVVENLGDAIDGDDLAMEFSFFRDPPTDYSGCERYFLWSFVFQVIAPAGCE